MDNKQLITYMGKAIDLETNSFTLSMAKKSVEQAFESRKPKRKVINKPSMPV